MIVSNHGFARICLNGASQNLPCLLRCCRSSIYLFFVFDTNVGSADNGYRGGYATRHQCTSKLLKQSRTAWVWAYLTHSSPVVTPYPEMSSITPGASSRLWGLRNAHMLSPYERTFVTHSQAVNATIQSRSVLATVDQQRPPGSPHREASTAQLWNLQAHPGYAARFSPLKTMAFTNAQKAELPGQCCVSGGRRYGCGHCNTRFKRRQELMRHVRDVHGSPRQCPLCPYEWTRAYKVKAHLLKVHSDELCPVVALGIRVLRGHDMIEFIDTHELLRGFQTPE
ncbi:hypothetical protein H4582DRAFT_1038619 [Lactarius indigo]|nr:hypothetical protein H4582DRAFT_1038619 [Lactarius indigo]